MNPKERAVLIFLIAVLLAGVTITTWRKQRLQSRLRDVAICRAQDSLASVRAESVSTTQFSTSSLVNLNTASPAELELLPGIGPVLAQRIADYRATNHGFRSKTELLKVPGIGPKKYAALERLITTAPGP
ncbi:MAG: helix-hairpin-helix domain-containing protein [candidate division WOR-3 bacterium]